MQSDDWPCEVMGRDAEEYLAIQTAGRRYETIHDDARGCGTMVALAQ
jgi:hypothetical protein